MRKLLLPVDGSTRVRPAIEYVMRHRGDEDVQIHLLNVQPPVRARELWHFLDFDGILEARQAAGEDVLREAREEVRRAGFDAVASVCIGAPAETIMNYASRQRCESIVMGAARPRVARLLEGSVSRSVARHARIPVTVIP
ncbi:MAG TPA: universal stress protein [Burkholderiales bacterium]|jgi:nucleotide-binding universal stress UspA family protein|nr:universal stress protein [Burkholderiales bacterium]